MNHQQRIDLINLHIYLGRKQGFDVSDLIEMRQQRYLMDGSIYK